MTAPNREKTPLEELGVDSIEEAQRLIEIGRKDHDRTGFLARKLERLERKLSEREDRVPDNDQDTDPTIRQLRNELRTLRSTVAEMVENADDEMKSLKPYFDEVLEDHPDLKGWSNSKTKLQALKLFARELHKQDHPDDKPSSAGNRAYREGSGAPVTSGPTRSGGENELKRRLEKAKTRNEKKAVMDQWMREHPPDDE